MAGTVRCALAALLLAAVPLPAASAAGAASSSGSVGPAGFAPAVTLAAPASGPPVSGSPVPSGAAPNGTASGNPAPGNPAPGGSPTATPTPTATPSAQDLAFLEQAHLDNLAEIQIGTIAEHRATSQAARNLGARLVREHTSLDADLQRIATRLGVAMPTAPALSRQRQITAVGERTGVAFDQAWVSTVTEWNNQAVNTDQAELRAGGLTDVVDLARDALAVARGHLSRLQKVPTEGPGRPTPVRTNVEDYSATQSPLVVSVAVVMIVLGVALLTLAVRAALRARVMR